MLNGNCLSISFEKVAISLAFFTLKNFELLQNVGILRVLKNRELQIREIQGRELQGLPVVKKNLNSTFLGILVLFIFPGIL